MTSLGRVLGARLSAAPARALCAPRRRSLCSAVAPGRRAPGSPSAWARLSQGIGAQEALRRAQAPLLGRWQQQQVRFHGDDHVDPDAKTVHIVFVKKDGSEQEVEGKVGQNLLRLAQKNGIELEGACECSLACSTCHVILEGDVFDQLEDAVEEEEDMLDQAFGLTETSRLGCQVHVEEFMEGTRVTLPKATRNFYVDGHVPEPH